jgi:hypothetical protein
MKILRWLAEFTIVAILMFTMAYLFLDAWDRTEYVNQAKAANRAQAYAPAAPTGLTPNYGESSEPRVHTFKDASRGRRGE